MHHNSAMAAIETKIWLALKSRIETLPLSFDKAWPATPFYPDYEKPYLRIGKIQTAPVRMQIASGKAHERNGSLIITLVSPLGQDASYYENMQGVIAKHFADGTLMRNQDVCVNVPQYPHCVEGYEDEGWWTAPVRIHWRCFA